MRSNTYTTPKWLTLLGIILAFFSFKLLRDLLPQFNKSTSINLFIKSNLSRIETLSNAYIGLIHRRDSRDKIKGAYYNIFLLDLASPLL